MHTLFINSNKVKNWDEVGRLALVPELKTLLLVGNPVYGEQSKDENAPMVVKMVPQIEIVDGKMITSAIRKLALEME